MLPRSMTVRTLHVFMVIGLFAALHTFYAPRSRGFDCADFSIQHPFKPIIFRTSWLFICALFLPWLFIYFAEASCDRTRQVVRFLFGFVINLLVTEIVKRFVGRLRPHTFEFCNLQRYCPNSEYLLLFVVVVVVEFTCLLFLSFPFKKMFRYTLTSLCAKTKTLCIS